MRTAARILWTGFFGLLIFSSLAVYAGTPASVVNLPESGEFVLSDEDEAPDVTARVSRISFVRGEVQIRRFGVEGWEKATLNLPVVEGDEILTESGGRVEIQFDNHKHLRLAENSYLKIANLKDEGIAVSLSLGTLNLRLTSFDKDKSYFEIDAPKTTIAVQRAGTYRVDAGKTGDTEIRVTAMDGGEARVYSDNAGFTLKNGRSSRIYIDGPTSGEWETVAASRSIDEFDEWSSNRDSVIAKRLRDAYYDRYYDQDIYGADDLNDHGAWVHTRDYGYVWRPHTASISVYADWSPYRYGHWRWMPPYGWIWVNDEPWGWATYHHGRWIWDNGYWVWSPYGYYRTSRSWWRPALVVINIFNNNVCWYPLGYRHRYNNYNSYNNPVRHNPNQPNLPTGGIKPIPSPTPSGVSVTDPTGTRRKRPPLLDVPPGAVVAVTKDDFGANVKGSRRPPLAIANAVIARNPDEKGLGTLPTYRDVSGKINGDIKAERPRIDIDAFQAKTGAAPRKSGESLDTELRVTRVFGGRPPVPAVIKNGGDVSNNPRTDPRRTGAVERPPVVKQNNDDRPVREPVYTPPRVRDEPKNEPKERTPRYEPPPVRETPRYEPPARTEKPSRNDPPPTREPQKSPPPMKSEPKPQVERGKKPDSR